MSLPTSVLSSVEVAKRLKGDAGFFLILASLALSLGLVFNALRDNSLPLIYQDKEQRLEKAVARIAASEVPALPSGNVQENLSLQEFQVYVENRQALILDARAEIFYRFGHVPGALPLPRDDFENAYGKIRSWIEGDKSKLLIVYCSNSACEDSTLVQKALKKLGYGRISMFHGGWAAWTQAGLSEEKNP